MELDVLKTMWQNNEAILEKNIRINEQQIALIQSQKVASKMKPLYRQRIIECSFHIAAIVLLLIFLAMNISQPAYALSAIGLLAFYGTTLVNALKQIKLLNKIDFNQDLVTLQSNLVLLQTHVIDYAKLAVLFIPTFLAYPIVVSKAIKDFNIGFFKDFDIIAKSGGNWWILMVSVSIVLIPLGIWWYYEVSYKNIHKPFVKRFIEKSSGKRISQALEFLKELQDAK